VYLNLEAQLRKLKDFRPEVKDGLAKFLDDFCTADGFCAVEDVGRKPQAADRKIKGRSLLTIYPLPGLSS
jgi:hypothetical protein